MKLTVATSCLLLLPWWISAISVDGDLSQRSLALGRRSKSVDDTNEDPLLKELNVDSFSPKEDLPSSTDTPVSTANKDPAAPGNDVTKTEEPSPPPPPPPPPPTSTEKNEESATASPVAESIDNDSNNNNNNKESTTDKQEIVSTSSLSTATPTPTAIPTPTSEMSKTQSQTKTAKSAPSDKSVKIASTPIDVKANNTAYSLSNTTDSNAVNNTKVKTMSTNDTQESENAPPINAKADPIKLIFSAVVVINGLILAFVGFRYPRLTMFYSGIITFGTIALVIMNAIHPYDANNSKLTFIYLMVTLFAGVVGSCIFLGIGHRMTPGVGLMGGLVLAAVVRAVLPQVKSYVHLALVLGLPVLGLTATLCMKRVTVIFSTALAGATVASFGADLVIGTYFLFYGVYRKNAAGEYVAIPIAWAQWAVLVFVAFVSMIFQLMKYRGEFYRDPKKRFRMSTHPITL